MVRVAVCAAIAASGPAILVAADVAGTWAAHPAAAADRLAAQAPPAPRADR